ncbi:MAG: hypothetical protein JJ899_05925 [Alphaproteobacteria bacterium]|nr:hypothetical protein [Alphaproteobacteria bacterium]
MCFRHCSRGGRAGPPRPDLHSTPTRLETLKLVYKLCAVALAVVALAVLLYPGLLLALADDASVRVNATNIRISFFLFVVWAMVTLLRLSATRPDVRDWPAPGPLWIGAVWLVLCVSYTGFEHGWFAFSPVVYEEDGVFETATAIVLLICTAMLLVAGLGRARRIDRRLSAALVGLAVVCFLLLMEEISWGQRIFGWATPETLEDLNAQNETNLHNMFVGYNQVIRLVIALLLSSALLARKAWEAALSRIGLARLVPPAGAIYFIPFLIYAHTYDELFEEVVGVFLIVYVFNLYRRLAAAPRSA